MIDLITGLALKSGASWLATKFKTSVIDRWSKRRAEAFFQTFVERLALTDKDGRALHELEPLLTELFDDELKSEVLFDAYRKVTLSASRALGPRVIAVLTARLVAQSRVATAEEERLLMVAESFGDNDFSEFSEYIASHRLEKNVIELFDDSEDSNWNSGRSIALSPVNLGEHVGNWCLKLAAVGLVAQDIEKKSIEYNEDSERHIDMPGTLTTYTWKLVFQSEVLELQSIVEGLRLASPSGDVGNSE